MNPAPCLNLDLGGARLRFEGRGGLVLDQPPGEAHAAFVNRSVGASWAPDLAIDIRVSRGTGTAWSGEARTEPQGERLVFDTEETWRLEACGDRRRIVMQPPGQPAPLWSLESDRAYERFELACGDAVITPDRVAQVIRYPLDQLLAIHALARHRHVLLHSAGVVIDSRALLLAGASGAGKSTVSRLLGEVHPRAPLLSDDRILLHAPPSASRIQAWGTPWPGEAGIACHRNAPLGALGFLVQSTRTCARPISPREALPRLLEVASVPWYEPDLREAVLATLETVLVGVPLFELQFARTAPEVGEVLARVADAA